MSNKTDLFKGQKPGDVLEALESNAYLKEKTQVQLPLTQGEIDQLSDQLAISAGALYGVTEEKARADKKFKALMDPLKKEVARCSKALHEKSYEVDAVLYGLANFEDGTMDFYDEKGQYISSRRLKSSERQGSIHTLTTKTA